MTAKTFTPLPEQQKIIDSTESSIKVKAGAGTGKTSTLVGYAGARSGKKILYLAFNKAIQQEAESRFTKNVLCRTTHSIAYGKEGAKFRQKLAPCVRAIEVSKKFNVNIGLAYAGIKTLNAWMQSADKSIGQTHAKEAEVPNNNIIKAVQIAGQMWDIMTKPDDLSISMVHDGYLKLYQLAGHQFDGYDIVLMDEAQDANPVTSSIVMNFKGAKALVGDANQSIYAFRGAKNAMSEFSAKEYLLRTSFRFGQQVGDVANTIIEYGIGDSMRIIGGGPKSVVCGPSDGGTAKCAGTRAVISRTNGYLIARAIENIEQGRSFSVVGGPEGLKLDMLMDAYRLYSGKENLIAEIKNPFFKQFDGWDHFEYSATESTDPEMLWLSKVVGKYRGKLPSTIVDIRNNLGDYRQADEVLVTGHKSKGLEFDHVTLGEDFAKLCEGNKDEGIDPQECNLIYVAATRAKKVLVLNSDLGNYMDAPVKNRAVWGDEQCARRKL